MKVHAEVLGIISEVAVSVQHREFPQQSLVSHGDTKPNQVLSGR